VIVVLCENNEVFSCKLKTENREPTLDHCVEPKLTEVVVEERNRSLVVGSLELNQFDVSASVVLPVPSGT
jgi:hypothetical protein